MASPCVKVAHLATCAGSQEDKVQGALPAKAKLGGRQLCFRGHSRDSHCRGKQAMGLQVLHQVLGAALQPAPGCHMVGVKVFTGTFSLGSG